MTGFVWTHYDKGQRFDQPMFTLFRVFNSAKYPMFTVGVNVSSAWLEPMIKLVLARIGGSPSDLG